MIGAINEYAHAEKCTHRKVLTPKNAHTEECAHRKNVTHADEYA